MTRLERVRRLAEYLGVGNCFEVSVHGRDGATLTLNYETGGGVLSTWMESGHNGDPYAIRNTGLGRDAVDERLEGIEAGLWRKAEQKVEEEARAKREAEAAKELRNAAIKAVFGPKKARR